MTDNDKVRKFLQLKLDECQKIINKRKKRNKIIKTIYLTLIGFSVVGSSTIVILSSVAVPPIAIGVVSGMVTLATGVSIKFNLRRRKDKLERSIQELNKIKDRIDYVISCNGDLSKDECNKILNEFRVL